MNWTKSNDKQNFQAIGAGAWREEEEGKRGTGRRRQQQQAKSQQRRRDVPLPFPLTAAAIAAIAAVAAAVPRQVDHNPAIHHRAGYARRSRSCVVVLEFPKARPVPVPSPAPRLQHSASCRSSILKYCPPGLSATGPRAYGIPHRAVVQACRSGLSSGRTGRDETRDIRLRLHTKKEATTLYPYLNLTTPTAQRPQTQDNICTPYLQHSHWPASASALDKLALVSSPYLKLGACCGPSSLPIAREEGGGVGDRSACSNPDPDFFPFVQQPSFAAACPGIIVAKRTKKEEPSLNPTKSSILDPPAAATIEPLVRS
ncbi:hypothetical protein NA56DRAFT_707959 [Hyaloscypha hepaticicola]|uniref:Uncharacterized protein n=1 Tax=Hyaloscypha hepaticicola TaxID=2082293 RepID=A0A2J6PSS9_9HELO|nr:hypothetical protein NA56DRAFT_707959 [Hyaloscypha hepaticicola]